MEFFADKNTSCYCLATIKSATVGGLPRQAERLPFNLKIVLEQPPVPLQFLIQN
jgi:hypothetical protein